MKSEVWNWERCKTKIRTLRGRLGFPDASALRFLELSLFLRDGRIYDNLRKKHAPYLQPRLYCILSGYAEAQPIPESHKLISFAQLTGGRPYREVFEQRAAKPLERTFGSKVSMLHKAASLLGGRKMDYGDCSVKIYSLPLVPIVVVMWSRTPEFPASANILFDSTANNFLSTEQLVMLSELTSARLRHAFEILTAKGASAKA
jgi:hypothetical protein